MNCQGTNKAQFPDERTARVELARVTMQAMYSEGDSVFETGIFECTYCGLWHLTSKPRNDQLLSYAPKRGMK